MVRFIIYLFLSICSCVAAIDYGVYYPPTNETVADQFGSNSSTWIITVACILYKGVKIFLTYIIKIFET